MTTKPFCVKVHKKLKPSLGADRTYFDVMGFVQCRKLVFHLLFTKDRLKRSLNEYFKVQEQLSRLWSMSTFFNRHSFELQRTGSIPFMPDREKIIIALLSLYSRYSQS